MNATGRPTGAAVLPPRPSSTGLPRDVGRRLPQRVGLAGALLIAFAVVALWSWSTPLMASPDEPSHIVEAAGVVRGTGSIGTVTTPAGTLFVAEVPASLASLNGVPACFAFRPAVTAECAPPLAASTGATATNTQFGNYPPLFYAVSGLPTLLDPHRSGVWGMRLLDGALCALALSAGLVTLRGLGAGGGPLLGGLVAITPMTLFLAGTVNTSGLEICAAFASWCAGAALARGVGPPSRGVLATWALSCAVYALVRPLSAPMLAVELAVLALAAGWARLSELLRVRAVLVAAGVVLAGALAAAAHQVLIGSPMLLGVGTGVHGVAALRTSVGKIPALFHEMVGVMGWLDSPVPGLTMLAWVVLLSGCAVAGVLTLGARELAAAVLLLGAVVVIPVVLEAASEAHAGAYWQGRYTLPLAVGLPVLLALRLDLVRTPARRRILLVVGGLLVVGHLSAFWSVLRRYTVGVGGSPLLRGAHWQPPGGVTLLALAAAAVTVTAVVGLTQIRE